jgi:two-component system, OmpR family, sensor kinase
MTTRRAALSKGETSRAANAWAGALRWPLGFILKIRGALGRHLSIRWKLTLWYAVVYAVTLIIIGFSLPTVLGIQNDASIDSELRSTAQQTQTVLSRMTSGPPQPGIPTVCSTRILRYCHEIQATLDRNFGLIARPGQFEQIQLLDPVTGRSPLFSPQGQPLQAQIPFTPLEISNVASNDRSQFVDKILRGTAVRGYLTPLTPPPALRGLGVSGVLEVFQPKATYAEIQRALNLILILAIPIGLITSLLFGWWIARAALRPIDRISRTVRSIGDSRDLSRRLHFVGPYDEVGHLAGTFDEMMDRLQQAFETQKRFIADASHELRTPLTAIRGNADLMVIAPPDERDICLTAIRREAERMSRLVSDLLLLAEADVEKQPMHMTAVDLDELVADVHHAAVVLAAGKVSVILDRADSVSVLGDPDRLKQLVLNLVDNAVKFTPERGTVSLAVCRDDAEARIEVADSGIGIPEEEQQAIFQRFYRVDESRARRGTGLGLAICAWIASAHGGQIEVKSEPGKGSTFVVKLPVLAPSSRVPAQPALTTQ